MSVSIKYKGEEIASASTETTKTIKTSGKYCEGDIEVVNTQDGGITPSGKKLITDTSETDVAAFATAQISSDTLLAENIKKNVNILGILGSFEGGGGGSLPSSISKIAEGEIALAVDAICNSYNVEHGLGVAPKFVLIYSDEMLQFQEGAAQYLVYYSASCVPIQTSATATDGGLYVAGYRQNNGSFTRSNSAVTQAQVTTQFGDTTFTTGINVRYKAGKKYKWIAWA